MTKRKLQDNEARAFAKTLRISPFKLALVVNNIRGKKCSTALNELKFSRKKIAEDVKKVLQSAVANAENNHGLDINNLFVSRALVGKGIVMKRMRARAKGRGAKIIKPFSNLLIEVREFEESK